MDQLQSLVSLVIVQAIFYSGFAAPAVMATFWPWWRSELGWSIVAKTFALSLALLPAMLLYWLGPTTFTTSSALRWFSIAALGAVPLIVWWRVWVIYRFQRDGSKHP